MKEAEDYLIRIANKKQEETMNREKTENRHSIRIDFWTNLLHEMNKESNLFRNISSSKDNWLVCGSGFTGLVYAFTITGNYSRIELWINKGAKVENKKIFDKLYLKKEKLELSFGHKLDWQRRDEGKGSRIAYWQNDVSVFNEDDWPEMIEFLTENMIKFERAMKDILKTVL